VDIRFHQINSMILSSRLNRYTNTILTYRPWITSITRSLIISPHINRALGQQHRSNSFESPENHYSETDGFGWLLCFSIDSDGINKHLTLGWQLFCIPLLLFYFLQFYVILT